jgi:hypothetical protein
LSVRKFIRNDHVILKTIFCLWWGVQYRRQLSTFLETPLGKSVVVSVPLLFCLFSHLQRREEVRGLGRSNQTKQGYVTDFAHDALG